LVDDRHKTKKFKAFIVGLHKIYISVKEGDEFVH
jgi:hypothetical protein